MPEAGFFAQQRGSPSSLALVILLHAALIAAVIMIKGPLFIPVTHPRTIVDLIEAERDPPPNPPPPRQERQQQLPERITYVPPVIPPVGGSGPVAPWTPPQPPPGSGTAINPPPPDPPAAPVRRGAELDPRYVGELQPPYPAAEQRAQRDGRVQVRVTIAPSGRVSAVVRLTATSDAFWRVTEQQALNHWRFRPATVDGRPVESSKVMTLVFRIEDAA